MICCWSNQQIDQIFDVLINLKIVNRFSLQCDTTRNIMLVKNFRPFD